MRQGFRALCLVVAAAAVATAPFIASPAQAAVGPVGYSSCVRVSPSHTYSTYATAENNSVRVSASTRQVKLNVYGTGKTYDCGPAGRAQNVPTMRVAVSYTVRGSEVNCSIGGSVDGNVSYSCAASRNTATITDSFVCTNTATCQVSDIGVIFTAAGNGRIDRIDTTSKITISGPSGQTSSSSYVTPYQR